MDQGFEADFSGAKEFGRLLGVANPTIDDIKSLALLEASGELFYEELAAGAPNDAVKRLLARNGQEEAAHAHRLKRVIKILTGEEFNIPERADNPYCVSSPVKPAVTKESLTSLVQAEVEGDKFYERWASAMTNVEAAKLLRQNGKEESRHGERLAEAIRLF